VRRRRPQPSGRPRAAAGLGAGLLAIVGLAACGPGRWGEPPDRIRLSVGSYLVDAVAFVAAEHGIFAAHGLDVELVVINRSAAALPLLVEGEIDAGLSGPLNPRIFNVIQRGGDVRIVAARTFYDPEGCPHDTFVARSSLLDSGRLTDAASLRGLRITTERTGSNYYYFGAVLAQGGLTIDDVELVDMPVPARGDAFAKGLVDVGTATEPWASRMTRDGTSRVWKRVADVLPGFQSSFLLFGRRLLGERRDLGARFLAAYLAAARQLDREGKSVRNVETISRWTKLDPDELREMCWPPAPPDPRPDARTLADFQSWALERHLIDAVTPYEQLVDSDFSAALDDARPTASR
jgi:NitT/TauT family transport system substrate-binding protein